MKQYGRDTEEKSGVIKLRKQAHTGSWRSKNRIRKSWKKKAREYDKKTQKILNESLSIIII